MAYCDHVRGMRRALPFLIVLVAAAPAQAQGLDRHTRSSATKALERAQRLADGRGVRTGRELSAALQQVVAQRSDLSSTQREQADRLLARPTDPTDDGPGGPFSPAATVVKDCTDAHFCIHWVETTNDAPPLEDADDNDRPDYIDDMIEAISERRRRAGRRDIGEELTDELLRGRWDKGG